MVHTYDVHTEGGWGLSDSTDGLREWDSDKERRGSKNMCDVIYGWPQVRSDNLISSAHVVSDEIFDQIERHNALQLRMGGVGMT